MGTINAAVINDTLEKVVERVDDPTALVYQKLFAAQPDMQAMFIMDTDGSVRGHMLSEALDGIIDFIGERHYADNLIRSEIVNHEGMGVPPEVFSTFFATVRDTFRDILAADWTDEMERAWDALLDELSQTIHQHA